MSNVLLIDAVKTKGDRMEEMIYELEAMNKSLRGRVEHIDEKKLELKFDLIMLEHKHQSSPI